MLRLVGFVLSIALGVQVALAAPAEPKSYANDYLASEAVRLEAKWKATVKPSTLPTAKVKPQVLALAKKSDFQGAHDLLMSVLVADPADWSLWNAFAEVTTQLKSDNYQENYALQTSAKVAAYLAYQRATAKGDQIAALDTLANVFLAYKLPRDALTVLRSGVKLIGPKDTGPVYAKLKLDYDGIRADFGFRILDYKLDSDSASPRACFQFSEDLQAGKVDLTPYVTVSGVATPAVSVQPKQLCVEGLVHGKTYHVTIRKGLPSTVGEDLLANADYDLYVRDRRPNAQFTGRNYVLPRVGQEGIPVVTVNAAKVDITVYRLGDRSLLPTVRSDDFLHELNSFSAETIANEKGQQVWTGTLDVKSDLNKDVMTAFPVMEALGKLDAGIYVMTASIHDGAKEGYETRATQWFLVSDLGLTSFTGPNDGLHVFVRSLATAEPASNVTVRLLAKNNEQLATVTTDASGHALFSSGLVRGKGGLAPGMIVAEDGKGDYGFLDEQQTAFDLTDRGVKGRETPIALDAFLYTERGVYRSGETVNITALLRDVKGKSVPGLPLTLVAERSDGVEYRRMVVADQGEGGRAWSIPIVSGAPTGTWHVRAFTDIKQPAIGDITFLIEDYVPERIDMKVTPDQAALHVGEPLSLSVSANFLYGAPADGLALSGTEKVDLAPSATVPGLAGWTVGLDDEPFEAISKEIEGENTTDEHGAAKVAVELPPAETTRPLQATVNLTITESGGRTVERSVTVPILPAAPVLAVKKLFDDGGLSAGNAAKFQVLFVTPDGKRLDAKAVKWQLSRIDRRYQWYNSEGRWDFEVIKSTRRMADGSVDIAAATPADISAVVDWGQYRLDVTSDDPAHPHTSVTFWVGWGGADKADTPDVLDVATDSQAYAAGDEVKVRLTPRFAGKATIAIVSDKIETMKTVDVTPDGTTVSFPADVNWGAGAYAVALAYRPLDVSAHRMPGRAIGVSWFAVDRPARTLALKLDVPSLIRPRTTLATHLKVDGLTPGEQAHVTISAVDVGILNLTHYETPNPENYVFGQRLLAGDWRDLYGYLIDGMQGTRGTITVGGDADAKKVQAPPDQAPLSRYSGVLTVAPDGTVEADFDIPTFNGTARVAAVAWTANRLGHAEADVIIRDPIVMQATLPRFLAIGDQSRLQLAIDNVEGPAGNYTLDIEPHGPVTLAATAAHTTAKLAAKGKLSTAIAFTAKGLGTASFDVKLSAPGISVSQTLSVPVQPATPAVYHRSIQPLAANGGSITLSEALTKDFVPGTGVVSVSVGPQAAFDVASLLKQLDRYPYGCTEQTVSIALPLLYANKLAQSAKLDLDGGIDERVKKAIATVLSRQDSNGSFGLWGVGGDDVWLDSFVGDFLTRARERGFEVPQGAMTSVLDRLRNYIVNTSEPKAEDSAKIAYAAYVLARNGRPVIGDLRYLADTKPEIFTTPLSRGQVGAALALLGDRGRAMPLFEAASTLLQDQGPARVWRADYGTPLRDGAGLIALMAEANAQPALLQKVERFVGANRETVAYTSTQENSWMVMAAFATAHEADAVALTVDGEAKSGPYYATLGRNDLDGKALKIVNSGAAALRAVVNASGHPIQPEPAQAHGFSIERSYLKLDGTPVDIARVKQSDRLVVVLKVTEVAAENGKLMLVDHLPAGFEIDNPDLVKSADLTGFDFLNTKVEAKHTEFRDDRFVATYDRDPGQSAFFYAAYMIRAVSPGKYVLPPATIEDMYRPERFGRTGFGTVEVTAAK
jgi:uncharacterized protein YfaS (alpha-2-macroglobulin family)